LRLDSSNNQAVNMAIRLISIKFPDYSRNIQPIKSSLCLD
jgi:hypothetical protein